MIHFIYGDQPPMINKRIQSIAKDALNEIDDMNYVKLDASQTLIQECVDEANYVALGYNKKVVLIDDCYFLMPGRNKNKLDADQDYQSLIDYINNPNPSTELIIVVRNSELNEKNEIVSLLKEKAKVLVARTPEKDEFKDYIKRYVTSRLNAQIDNAAIEELASRCEGNVLLMQKNAEKLALYSPNITFDDVCLLVTKPLEENTFQVYNSLINRRLDEALRIYRDLLASNVEPLYLISNLSNQFRLLNEVSYLSKTGKSADEIASLLKIKPVRATIIKRQTSFLSESTIRKALDDLYQLELQIKSGQVDRNYAFELFLINFKVE